MATRKTAGPPSAFPPKPPPARRSTRSAASLHEERGVSATSSALDSRSCEGGAR